MDMGFYDELKRETGEKWLEIIKQVKEEKSKHILDDENKIKKIESNSLYQKGEAFL